MHSDGRANVGTSIMNYVNISSEDQTFQHILNFWHESVNISLLNVPIMHIPNTYV
jgi:hypothetical protein